ncbi:hypothetical protein FRC02_000458 [Tulasnella sp. 418]|nr:hypothetical protein FRC02_000458 [Tulasnella sp. 418]
MSRFIQAAQFSYGPQRVNLPWRRHFSASRGVRNVPDPRPGFFQRASKGTWPIELWPLFALVGGACVLGGTMLGLNMYNDKTIRVHEPPRDEPLEAALAQDSNKSR